jgi:hypothetical protein
MPTNAIESHIGNLWRTKQTTLGTIEAPSATTMKQVRKATDEGLKAAKQYGMEEYVDGQSWGFPGSFVDAVGGDVGSIGYQVQIETGGVAFAAISGTDTVTGSSPNFTHTITTTTAQGILQTYYVKTGSAVLWRQSWYDARVNKLTFTCGQDQQVARIVENVLALKAGNWFGGTDPTAADSGTDPFNWNEVTGSIAVNSITLPEAESETVEFDRKLDVHRGDNAAPVCFLFGKGQVTRAISALVTDTALPIIKQVLFNTTTPSDGQAVSQTVVQVPITSTYTRNANRSLAITTPLCEVDPNDFEIAPKPEGGKIPITFGGRCKASAGVIATIVAKTGDSAAYI